MAEPGFTLAPISECPSNIPMLFCEKHSKEINEKADRKSDFEIIGFIAGSFVITILIILEI
jgi:hypothetical protein